MDEGNSAVEDFDNQKDDLIAESQQDLNTEIESTIEMFRDIQNNFFESINSIQNSINQSIENIKASMQNQLENIQQNMDEYTVESKDINGVKFVVITNKTAQN